MRARRLLTVTIGAVVAALAVGCGVPKDSSPRPIAQDKVPFGLLGPATTQPNSGGDQNGNSVVVWFVSGQRLQAVTRTVPDVQPKTVLDALVKGPAMGDPDGLSSAIPQNTTIVSVDRDGQTLVVTLSSAIVSVTGPEQKNAFAQLTFTATGLQGVSGVRYRALDSSGQPQDLEPPTDRGNQQGPLTKADFNSLAPVR
jgi:hypothetical protein